MDLGWVAFLDGGFRLWLGGLCVLLPVSGERVDLVCLYNLLSFSFCRKDGGFWFWLGGLFVLLPGSGERVDLVFNNCWLSSVEKTAMSRCPPLGWCWRWTTGLGRVWIQCPCSLSIRFEKPSMGPPRQGIDHRRGSSWWWCGEIAFVGYF